MSRDAVRALSGLLAAGRPHAALEDALRLLESSHVVGRTLEASLDVVLAGARAIGRPRAVATVLLFRGAYAEVHGAADAHPIDRARAGLLAGRVADAARLFEAGGFLAHAAFAWEEIGADRSAAALWQRLADPSSPFAEPYAAGLVRYNAARVSERLGDAPGARRARIEAVHLLEQAADAFEAEGRRERAFDCFQVLLSIGKNGAFENLAEGYLNCIRILSEDRLRHYALQYYEDFLGLASAREEHEAAASIAREAATFCARHGLPYERHYLLRAAGAHLAAADRWESRTGASDLVRSAVEAGARIFGELGAHARASELYRGLSQLEALDAARRGRYARLARRFAALDDVEAEVVAYPDYLKLDAAYPEVWRLDVLEHEHLGDPVEAMGEVMLDARWPEHVRRRALIARLHVLTGPSGTTDGPGLAARLGRLEIYASLAPLERLYRSGDAPVRAAVLRASRQLYFKRTFDIVTRGLADTEETVRREALAAVAQLHFGHALDPLARILRSATDRAVRSAALTSIARIPSSEAAEIVLDALREGAPEERELAERLLIRAEHAELQAVLERALAVERGPREAVLRRVLEQRRRLR